MFKTKLFPQTIKQELFTGNDLIINLVREKTSKFHYN